MPSFSISYPDLIKLPYFVNLTQRGDRGWKEAQRQDDFKENSRIYWFLERKKITYRLLPGFWSCLCMLTYQGYGFWGLKNIHTQPGISLELIYTRPTLVPPNQPMLHCCCPHAQPYTTVFDPCRMHACMFIDFPFFALTSPSIQWICMNKHPPVQHPFMTQVVDESHPTEFIRFHFGNLSYKPSDCCLLLPR
jgi:hypothetical protein